MTTKIIVLALFALASFLIGQQIPFPLTVICHAGTETDITRPGEYPAWELDCDGPIRVIVVD